MFLKFLVVDRCACFRSSINPDRFTLYVCCLTPFIFDSTR